MQDSQQPQITYEEFLASLSGTLRPQHPGPTATEEQLEEYEDQLSLYECNRQAAALQVQTAREREVRDV